MFNVQTSRELRQNIIILVCKLTYFIMPKLPIYFITTKKQCIQFKNRFLLLSQKSCKYAVIRLYSTT